MGKSKLIKILWVIILVWLAATVYFYGQHEVTIKRHVIDKTLELENADLVFKEFLLMTEEANHYDFDSWQFDFVTILPDFLKVPFMKLCYFYSNPYQELPYDKVELRGKVLLHEKIGLEESLWDYYDIEFVDEDGLHYGSRRTTINEGGNTIYFAVSGIYYNKVLRKVDIVIKGKSSEDYMTIPVELNWQTEKYNYFNRAPLNLQPHRLDY